MMNAGGGDRTRMGLLPRDFKSVCHEASAEPSEGNDTTAHRALSAENRPYRNTYRNIPRAPFHAKHPSAPACRNTVEPDTAARVILFPLERLAIDAPVRRFLNDLLLFGRDGGAA